MDVLAQYPFPQAQAAGGEAVWVSGDAIVAIGEIIQRAWPLPDPDCYSINETARGVEFTFDHDLESESSSSSYSSSPPSESYSSSVPSSSKMAIVPVETPGGGEIEHIAWHCVERPQVIFETVLQLPIDDIGRGEMVVPWEFVASVVPKSIVVTSVLPVGGRGRAFLQFDELAREQARESGELRMPVQVREPWARLKRFLFGRSGGQRVREVVVRIEAIRRGFEDVNYERKTEAEAVRNNAFWRVV